MSLNLFEKLSKEDKETITQYIYAFGVQKKGFLGLEPWLYNWAKSKPRLYHLLGGEMIYKFPFNWEKSKNDLNLEISTLIETHSLIKKLKEKFKVFKESEYNIGWEELNFFNSFIYSNIYLRNETSSTLKYRKNSSTKMLQLQLGMKPVKALQKIINYFEWNDLKEDFEDFRIQHSMILNDKIIYGTACISIHPLDFITMSDNNSSWSSCMSWKTNGCYSIGSVEMMNSNNVICCYLEGSKSWEFKEGYTWNNKKWRQLFYVTNDIAVCGKAYPYQNKDFSLMFLNKIKELSEENLKRSYAFGPEPYRDMIHVGTKYRMDKVRNYIRSGDTFKHNIIFDTKGMYNDFLNDHDVKGNKDLYWCYRNKVKKTKLINVSGKASCLCCGGSVIKEADLDSDCYDGAYNDRYEDNSKLVCEDCRLERSCYYCDDNTGYFDTIEVDGRYICKHCFNKYAKICPDCGAIFVPEYHNMSNRLFIRHTNDDLYTQDFYPFEFDREGEDENYQKKFSNACLCQSCFKEKIKDKKKFVKITTTPEKNTERRYYNWLNNYTVYISKEIIPKEKIKKYLYKELKNADMGFKN